MKAILIIAHHCILPGAYKGFEEILDRLHHDLPGTRVASTSLLDLENDLRTLLREDVESVMLLPYLLLNGQHSKNDVPRVVAKLQAEFPHIPITLLPCLGDWTEFSNMVVSGIRNAQLDERTPAGTGYRRKTKEKESSQSNLSSLVSRPSSNSNLFSIELNLEGRNVLVVGGGSIALRKVKTLLPTGARITVVAPQFDPEFEDLRRKNEAQPLQTKDERTLAGSLQTKDERGESRENKFTCFHDRALLSDAEGVNDERGESRASMFACLHDRADRSCTECNDESSFQENASSIVYSLSSLVLIKRPYESLDLRGIFMVFICTDQPAVNAQVSNDARARRILVNNACDYRDGDFIVPARMDFGENIAVTVSTQGHAPSLAKKLKRKIQADWGDDLAKIEREFKCK